ncbi:MAG: vWA domain-containing protein [Flavobacteriales bacterium]|nr:vWA domain-containing protein [Flavobacteriales bacterium]
MKNLNVYAFVITILILVACSQKQPVPESANCVPAPENEKRMSDPSKEAENQNGEEPQVGLETDMPKVDLIQFTPIEMTEESTPGSATKSSCCPTLCYTDGYFLNSNIQTITTESNHTPMAEAQGGQYFSCGQLTAGEINDFSKWELWDDIAEGDLSLYQTRWRMKPDARYSAIVQNEDGVPVVDCAVDLIARDGSVLWASKTDNTGKAELWNKFFSNSSASEVSSIQFKFKGLNREIKRPKEFSKGVNSVVLDVSCDFSNSVDILFAVDATGSMGDEIEYLKTELADIITKTSQNKPDLDIQLGTLFYRCLDNSYVTRQSPFSKNVNSVVSFISQQSASEGGNEAVEVALHEAVNDYKWNSNARARLLFLVLDEPPGLEEQVFSKLQSAVQEASKKGIRIIPLVSSGVTFDIDKSLEYLMRSIALATNGTYAFLTNDSGIGNFHTAPSTDTFKVEKLNQLLIRLIDQFTNVPGCTPIEVELSDSIVVLNNNLNLPLGADSIRFNLNLYPNPAHRHLFIESSEEMEEIYILDSNGKLILRLTPREKIIRIALDEYTNGYYIARCRAVDRWSELKFIISK